MRSVHGARAVASLARSPEAEQAAHERLAELQRVTAILNSAASAETITRSLPLICETIGATTGEVTVLSAGGQELELTSTFGVPPEVAQAFRRIPVESSVATSEAVRTRQPVFVDSRKEYDRRYRHTMAGFPGYVAGTRATLPLLVEGGVMGTISFGWADWRPIPPADRTFLLAVGGQCAQALDRARLFEAERRARTNAEIAEQRRAAIQLISDAALAHLEIDPLLTEMLARVRRVFRCDAATILWLSADGKRLEVRASDGIEREAWDRVGLPYGAGVAGTIVAEKRPMVINDVAAADVVSPILKQRLRSMMGAPLLLEREAVGLIHVGCVQPRAFAEADIELLQMVAARAAVAIDRASAHEAVQRAEQALRDSEVRHRTLFEAAVYGVVTIDEDGIIETANPAAERMFGYRFAELAGRNITLLMPEPYRSEHGSYLGNYLRTGQRKVIGIGREVVGLRKDGSQFPMDLAVSEFRVHDKRHFTGIVSDITERKQLEQAREAAVAELQQTLRHNEMFAAVLAHDLRNPLGAILTATKLVLHRHPEEAETALNPLHRAISSGERMTRMIDQLLDFTRARVGGGFELSPREADLAEICGQVLDEIALGHPEWKVKVESLGDFRGTWDRDRLLQVVSNLLTNAGLHGEPGAEILVKADGTERNSVSLEVHNDGTIPESLMPNLFSPFRGTRERGRGGGLGLGIYIMKQIVRAHGGTVDVTSSDAAGTTFKIRLPRRTRARDEASTR